MVDGVCGYVVPPGDAPALGAAISRLANDHDRLRAFGAAARGRIETDFHIDQTVDATHRLYREVIGSDPVDRPA